MSTDSRCFTVGIMGYCGPDCPVYKEGDCSEPQEMIPSLTPEELERHRELYSDGHESSEG